jgi:uncharacterized membrane protein
MVLQRESTFDPAHDAWKPRSDAAGKTGEGMATGLGWFSLALGLPALIRPTEVARAAGFKGDALDRGMMLGLGVREIATGLGILGQKQPSRWVWARLAGDMVDMSYTGYGLASGRAKDRTRALATLASLIGVTAADVRCAMQLSASRAKGRHADGRQAITVWRPPEEVYAFWRNFTNFPRFMHYVESVEDRGNGHSHWRAKGPFGDVEWDAEIVADRPGELIAWRSLPGSTVENSGEVRFRRTPDGKGTEVLVEMSYEPPAGGIGKAVAKVAGRDPLMEAHDDLRRFKQIVEVGEVVLSDATVDGAGMPQRAAQPVEQVPPRPVAGIGGAR